MKAAFSRKELVVIITIILASCGIPGSSLMRNFTNSLNLPHHFNKMETGRQDYGVLKMAPERMLATSDRILWIKDGAVDRLENRKDLDTQVGTVDGSEL